jgi:hypothetical protein
LSVISRNSAGTSILGISNLDIIALDSSKRSAACFEGSPTRFSVFGVVAFVVASFMTLILKGRIWLNLAPPPPAQGVVSDVY